MSNIFFGTPKGVEEGQVFKSRLDLLESGLHRNTQRGIDGNGNEGSAAIILSGGYEDDQDFGDEIIYTGEGGNDRTTGRQINHQTWESPGNKGLLLSKREKLPVRVIRGFTHKSPFSPEIGYSYAGLFKVVDTWEQLGKSGFKVCRFKLIKEDIIDNNNDYFIKEGVLALLEPYGKEAKWFSVGVDCKHAQKISFESKMAQSIINKKVGDTIDFGNGFKVLQIKKYLS